MDLSVGKIGFKGILFFVFFDFFVTAQKIFYSLGFRSVRFYKESYFFVIRNHYNVFRILGFSYHYFYFFISRFLFGKNLFYPGFSLLKPAIRITVENYDNFILAASAQPIKIDKFLQLDSRVLYLLVGVLGKQGVFYYVVSVYDVL